MVNGFFSKIMPFLYSAQKMVEPETPQMKIRRMRILCWIPKATNTHSEYVILTDFPLQQRLHERTSMIRYTYIACLVFFFNYVHMTENTATRLTNKTAHAQLHCPL